MSMVLESREVMDSCLSSRNILVHYGASGQGGVASYGGVVGGGVVGLGAPVSGGARADSSDFSYLENHSGLFNSTPVSRVGSAGTI